MKKTFVLGIILLFVCLSITPSSAVDNVKKSSMPIFNGNTLYVGGSGPDNYTSIQDAINDASNGDTVFVYDDSSPYYEHVILNKKITLIGEDKNTTIIDGNGTGDVVKITVNEVIVTGFTIQNSSHEWYYAGILILSSYNTVSNNIIHAFNMWQGQSNGIEILRRNYNNITRNIIFNYPVGIYLEDACLNNIAENTIFQTILGIHSYGNSNNNTMIGNNLSNILSNSIYLEKNLEKKSNDCLILNNFINNGGKAIYISDCDNIKIIGNEICHVSYATQITGNYINISNNIIYNCTYKGIGIGTGSSSIIMNNTISNCPIGIGYEQGIFGNISYNKISGCDNGVRILDPEKSNFIFKNEFKYNNKGVYADLKYGALKITCNNFINNKKSITFQQFLPFRRQTPKNPIFDKNYYDDWKESGPKVLVGHTNIFFIPFFFPDFPFFFILPIFVPGFYCDWHPAKKPYDIPIAG
jgi:parallel beta-helix repeat protein